ncbi:ATP-binding region ATPase domain protein [Desulfurispirillum indicum S5]|uniref:histidine kinase n=1 Tax=Desulfurispirillum indicum (strain ATCC BAA-1389 / DSM 22839 / S5) TaxID=653733 RepID=E6W4P6_DESIS|nr:HAMP domain-containing sensor histidine kinase [Desulfurispirillum indicum]ADU67119.1 ATP-binding region ATPase domain protein [Desulfurispirillum indicum S5]
MSATINVFMLYLFYGLAFFTIGVAITSKQKRYSKLKIARHLWLLAAFAFIHGLHEWFELYLILQSQENISQQHAYLTWFQYSPQAQVCIPVEMTAGTYAYPNLVRIGIILLSYGFLLAFGLAILSSTRQVLRSISVIIPLLLFIGFAVTIQVADANCQSAEECRFILSRVRNFFGLPAGLISGIALILYSQQVVSISEKGARSLYWCGVSLIVYGVLTGAVPSGVTFTPLGIDVELLRAISGFVILHFLMQAMHIFDIEYHRMLESTLNKLAHSSKLASIGRMAAGVAHQINTPLTNISLGLDMLKKQARITMAPDDPQYSKCMNRIEAIERNLQKAAMVARELLLFSRQKETDFLPLNLNQVIMGACRQVEQQLKGYTVRYQLQKVPPMLGIPWKLEEIYVNLLNNAMDATPPGGTITLVTELDGKTIRSRIIDTGAGIASEHKAMLFDPFFTTKPEGKGTGLGLFICYGIIQMHNGNIAIESSLGKGTTVIMEFPAGDNC